MLKFEIESLDGVDTSLHGFYDKTDNGYRLKVDGIEDTNGLKTALQKERESNKEAKTKLAELERLRDEAERKAMEENGRYKELSEKERNDKIQAEQRYQELQKKVAEKTRDIMVRDLAQSMTSDPDEQDNIITKLTYTGYVIIEGDEVKFSKPIEEVKLDMASKVKSKASGTNDGGNNKGGGKEPPLSYKEKQKAIFTKK